MAPEVPRIIFEDSGSGGRDEPRIKFQDFDDLRQRYDRQTNLIIGIFVVVMITMVIMTGTLVIDSFHFNSATYREYALKLESNRQILDSNEQVLKRAEEQSGNILRSMGEIKALIGKNDKQ